MSSGHIAKVHIVNFDLETYARINGVDSDLYLAEVNRAIADTENYYEDVCANRDGMRRADQEPDRQICFTDPAMPGGPYDLHLSYEEILDERDSARGFPPIKRQSLVCGFSVSGAPEIFFNHAFSFRQIRNALLRYENVIRPCRHGAEDDPVNRGFTQSDLATLIYFDLNREEGHKGIIARLFPANFDKNLATRNLIDGIEPPFDIDFGLACCFFDVFRAIFPKRMYDEKTLNPLKAIPEKPAANSISRKAADRIPSAIS